MTEPAMLKVTIKGGDRDGEQFDLSAEEAGAGDTVPYLDAHYRLIRGGGGEWIARPVSGDV